MLRLIQTGYSLPTDFPIDPSAEFMPGSIAELTVIGNQVMITVSSGTAPFGIFDDIKTKAFTAVSWAETIAVPAVGVPGPNNTLVTPIDVKAELKHAYIVPRSFISTVPVALNEINGIITFPAGTPLNFDAYGQEQPNSLRTIVNYSYKVANIPGDDSTLASGRATVWFSRMLFSTSQFETSQVYPVKSNVYCSETGLFTTRRPSPIHPAIGMVIAPPSPIGNGMLGIMWY
jgi:hypothetical protein